MSFELTYKPFGESSILIEWPSRIDPKIIQDITGFEKLVSKQQKVVDTVIAYNSLTVSYKYIHNYSLHYKHRKDFEKTVKKLKELYAMERSEESHRQRIWQVPVCYDQEYGLDLKEIAEQKNLSVDEMVQLHTKSKYLIYFLGFQPGFLYLGGLNEQIHMPRRPNPRLRVDKGSVGIGGEQTGVYPQDSAGGWNIIGKSPIDFFDISKAKPCFAKAGEFIQFVEVDKETFYKISDEVERGKYKLKFVWS